MISLGLAGPVSNVLCLGAHADDIEIGCGGTMLTLAAQSPLTVTWVVWSAEAAREGEARQSAEIMLSGVEKKEIILRDFRDGFFPTEASRLKEAFEELKATTSPDLILTHYRGDLHQDHRLIAELTWNTFRDHLILEYEIPKYDGDLGTPNVFIPLEGVVCRRKIAIILEHFRSQAGKRWFTEDLFLALLRLRGMEANAASTYAEAFYGRKLTFL